jgi:hypothetical protein
MARLVTKTVTPLLSAKVITRFSNGKDSEKELKKDDVVSGLRFIENESIVVVNGRVDAFDINNINKVFPKPGSSTTDTIPTDLIISSITVDESEEFKSKVTKVPSKEIVEDAGVVDVVKVDVESKLGVKIVSTYTDGTVDTDTIYPGDTLSDITILTQPGKPDITGSFDVVTLSYTTKDDNITINGLVLRNETGTIYAAMNNIIKIADVEETVEVDAEELREMLSDVASIPNFTTLKLTEDVTFEEPATIPEGKILTFDLSNAKITSDAVAFDNAGTLTLVGNKDESKGIVANMPVKNEAGGTVNINGAALEVTSADQVGGAAILNFGTLNVTDGVFVNNYAGSAKDAGGAALIRNKEGGNCYVANGDFRSASMRTYGIINAGNIVVDNATIDGTHGGYANDGNTAIINGGVYTSSQFYGLYTSNDDASSRVEVHGGTWDGKAYSLWVGSDDKISVEAFVKIYDGHFLKPLKEQSNVPDGFGIELYGGYYKTVQENFLAEGYGFTPEPDEEGFYQVLPINELPTSEDTADTTDPTDGE